MKTPKKSIRKVRKPAYNHIIKTFHNALIHSSGGFEKFASFYDRNASTVRNQFNINHEQQPTFELVCEAIEYLAGDDPVPMNAICHLGGGRFEPNGDDCEADELIPCLIHFASQQGEHIHTILDALEDGRISQSERQAIQMLIKEQSRLLTKLSVSLGGSDD
ncbi:MAG: hypothetical protein KGV56_04760 [Gammaproteobacteria bacterium]|nr:hypothetical protein [Gammaproteobacteria bacterium]